MFRDRRFAKPIVALIAAGLAVLVVSGCALIKAGSFTASQPAGVGPVRVHFVLCTIGKTECTANEETETLQYLVGIAVPPGSTPPSSFTAAPVKGAAPILFTRNDEVAAELAAGSAALQKAFGEAATPKEKEEAEQFEKLIGRPWPPSGLQGVGYLSAPVQENEGEDKEWSVDAEFGLPVATDGTPFGGPFGSAIAYGVRGVGPTEPSNRPVHCPRFVEGEANDTTCTGSLQELQLGTSDLRIAAPAKAAQAFVGGSAKLAFPLQFGGSGASLPSFALSATTTAKGGKIKLGSATFTPKTPNATTHLSPTATANVKVSVPPGLKPGTYEVTLTAKTGQGGTATGLGRLKVTKPTLKFRKLQIDAAKGTATLKVWVPGSGRLTISGKGVAKVKRKVKKAKTLKVKIAAVGAAGALLDENGSVKLKLKATFKPTSGVSVSKSRSVVLRLR